MAALDAALPPELIAAALAFLGPGDTLRAAAASRAVREAARSPEAWGRRVPLGRPSGRYGLLPPGALAALAALLRPPEVRELDLHGQWYVPFADLEAALRAWGPSLRALSLAECGQFTGADLARAAPLVPGLRALRAGRWRFLTDDGVLAVLRECPGLEELRVPFSRRLTDAVLRALAARGAPLVSLDLAFCTRLADAASLGAVARASPALRRLRLDGFDALTDAAVVAVAGACPRLEDLSVARCPRLTDEAPLALARGCGPALVRANFSQCRLLTDRGLAALCEAAPRLQRLLLAQVGLVTDRTVEALAASCPRLTHVSFAFCRRVTGAGLSRLAEAAPRLVSVDLEYCKQLDDADVAPLLCLPRLAHLNVSHSRLDGDGLEALLPPGTLPLAWLQAAHTQLRGVSLMARCPALRTLDVSFCTHLEAARLVELPRLCPNLGRVAIGGYHGVGPEVTDALHAALPAGASVRNFSGAAGPAGGGGGGGVVDETAELAARRGQGAGRGGEVLE